MRTRVDSLRPPIGANAWEIDAATSIEDRLTTLLGVIRSDLALVLAITPAGNFEVVAAAGDRPVPSAGLRVPGGEDSVCGFAALQHGAIIYQNVAGTSHFSSARMATTFGAVSSLMVAIHFRGEVVGILGVHSRTARSFDAAAAHALEDAAERFGADAALAVR